MAQQQLRGLKGPIPKGVTIDYDPDRGQVEILNYAGYSEAEMRSLQQTYMGAGVACRLRLEEGLAQLEIQNSATQQFTTDTWQILGNELSLDGLSHPTITAMCTDEMICKIRGGMETKGSSDDVAATIASILALSTFNSLSGAQKAILSRFIGLQFRGSTDYQRDQYVLKHTTNAPNRWGSNVADIGVGKLYTPAQLLSEAQSSALWFFPLPGRLAYKISNIPAPAFQSNYLWSWKKGPSTETTAANNRIDISTEYVLEQWSTDYYTPF